MQSRMAVITFMDESGGRPDNTLPGGGGPNYPSQGLPPGGALLPVYPFDPTRPDNTLPGGGHPSGQPVPPGTIDNTLPGGAVAIHPGNRSPRGRNSW